MTWQRIDENTYIDDTLVTCAEYQLFIDEMRELGKHYQPDHWTSYQYLDGQAKTPILGVRYFDAIEFCEWLTNKAGETKYRFRLPTQTEAEFSSLKIFTNGPIGYWLNQDQQFEWHNEFDNIGNWEIRRYWDEEKNISEEIIITRPLSFSSHHLILDLSFDPAVENLAPLFIDRIVDILGWIKKDEIPGSKRRMFTAMFLTKFNRNEILDSVIHNLLEHISSHEEYLNLGIALITIRERIAGRSPAFEGIRLVKERIK